MRNAVSAVVAWVLVCCAAAGQVAQRPPMGWNSWDAYGFTITERTFMENVSVIHDNLQKYGWTYAVMDEGWFLDHPENGGKPKWEYNFSPNGLYVPSVARFPSASGGAGLKPLAQRVHGLGMKFGIHIVRGIPRDVVKANMPIESSQFRAADAADTSDACEWNADNWGVKNNAAGQAYYDSMMKLYASWELDYLKVDCISRDYKDAEIEMIARALKKAGRPMVLSLSPGATPLGKAEHVRAHAQLWRISDDVWDLWKGEPQKAFPQGVANQFAQAAAWEKYAGPGHWPDADMLPIGYLGPHPGWGEVRNSRLTQNEQRTQLTLWAMARSPLIVGANLTRMDEFTRSLLTNAEVIAVDQDSHDNREVVNDNSVIVWTAKPNQGAGQYVAAFNVGDEMTTFTRDWKQLGVASPRRVRDLWRGTDATAGRALTVKVPPHACVLWRVE